MDGPLQGLLNEFTLSQSIFLVSNSLRDRLEFMSWCDTTHHCLLFGDLLEKLKEKGRSTEKSLLNPFKKYSLKYLCVGINNGKCLIMNAKVLSCYFRKSVTCSLTLMKGTFLRKQLGKKCTKCPNQKTKLSVEDVGKWVFICRG